MLPPSRVNVYTNVKSQNSLTPHLIWPISSIWNSSSVVPAGNPLFTRFPAHQTCLVSSPSTAVCCQWYWPQLWCLESPDSTFESILFFSRNHFPVDHTVEWLSVLSICESLCMCICIYVCTYLSLYLYTLHPSDISWPFLFSELETHGPKCLPNISYRISPGKFRRCSILNNPF